MHVPRKLKIVEHFDFHNLPAETRNFLQWGIKTSESCGKASGSLTTVFPRVQGPCVTFFMAACRVLCFRSMPNPALTPHCFQQCLHSIKAFSVILLPQQSRRGCARSCEKTQLGYHLACFAWEGYDKSTSFKLYLVIWALCYCNPVRCALYQSSLTHWTQFLSGDTQELWWRILQRLPCGLTSWPLCSEWGPTAGVRTSYCKQDNPKLWTYYSIIKKVQSDQTERYPVRVYLNLYLITKSTVISQL